MKYKYWIFTVLSLHILLFWSFNTFLFYAYKGLSAGEKIVYFKRDWIRSKISEKSLTKKNIVVLGDSTLTTGFLPNIFHNEHYNIINLSIVSHDASKNLYMLKDFIKHNYIPDFIIWYPSHKRDNTDWLNSGFLESVEYLIKTNNINILQGYLPLLNKTRRTRFVEDIFLSENLEQYNKLRKELLEENGSYYWKNKFYSVGKYYKHINYTPTQEKNWLNENDAYMLDIYSFLDFAKNKKIKVFIIEAPKAISSSMPSKKIPKYLSVLKEHYNNLKISDIILSTYYPTELFMDSVHLNYYGAKIYTKDILNSFERAYSE